MGEHINYYAHIHFLDLRAEGTDLKTASKLLGVASKASDDLFCYSPFVLIFIFEFGYFLLAPEVKKRDTLNTSSVFTTSLNTEEVFKETATGNFLKINERYQYTDS